MNDTAQRTASTPELEATIGAERLRTALEAVGTLVDECRVTVDPDGLTVAAVDAAAVAMVDLSLSASAFDAYEASEGEFGANLDRLTDVIGMADRDQSVHLTLDADGGTLRVRVGELDYTLGLIAPGTIRSPPEMGALETAPARVELPAEGFDRALGAAEMVADCATLGVDPDAGEFVVGATGDTDDVQFELPAADCPTFEAGTADSTVSLSYLGAVNRALPRDATVTLSLGTDRPVEPAFEFADGAGTVEYLVAPRTPVSR